MSTTSGTHLRVREEKAARVREEMLCVCCEVIPATGIYLCDGCVEHVSEEYARGYALGGCPVYDAWCRCEPFSWEVAA